MKAKIIYFSQQGGTQAIAEDIAEGIKRAGDDCELAKLKDTDPSNPGEYDLLGIGCPVFYFKEPFNVADFMDALPRVEGKHAFVFNTHGATPAGTLASMWKRLADKGYHVLGAHKSYADSHQIPIYPYPTHTTGHPDGQEHDEAQAFGQKMAETSRRVSVGETDLIPEPIAAPEGWWTERAIELSKENLAQIMPPFTIDPDRCTQCLVCEEVCPVDGIAVLEEPPRIQEPCIYCFHCVMQCPEVAIVADWESLMHMVPGIFENYFKNLDAAEKRGEFRRHMERNAINLDDPIFKQRERERAGRHDK
jgi:flavodoxin/NAD-dependent dihydropyrimidine dehydrogenase PreA subunit